MWLWQPLFVGITRASLPSLESLFEGQVKEGNAATKR
jgi:hypothetical protein